MKVLDLCCGAGGWSKGFLDEGFEVEGVDLFDVKDYPGKLNVCDLHDFRTSERYDVVVASPPCRSFGPPFYNYQGGSHAHHFELDLVWRCFQIVDELKPRYWIVENAKYIERFIPNPRHVVKNGINNACAKKWMLYGNFPIPGMFDTHEVKDAWKSRKGRLTHLSPEQRAMIPYPMARAFARAIKEDMAVKVAITK